MDEYVGQLAEDLDFFIQDISVGMDTRARKIVNEDNGRNLKITKKSFFIELPSSSHEKLYYDTDLQFIVGKNFSFIEGYCSCPYHDEHDTPCKHRVAAAMIWMNFLEVTSNRPLPPAIVNKQAVPGAKTFDFKLAKVDFTSLLRYTSWQQQNEANKLFYNYGTIVKEAPDNREWIGLFSKNTHASVAYKNEQELTVTCNCGRLKPDNLCVHAVAIFSAITRRSPFYFFIYHDHSKEKEALLGRYGLTPEDDLSKEFQFGIDINGNLRISHAPDYLLGSETATNWELIAQKLQKPQKPALPPDTTLAADAGYETALLFNFNRKERGGFFPELLKVKEKANGNTFKRLPFEKETDLVWLFDMPSHVMEQLSGLTRDALLQHLVDNGFLQFKDHFYDPWKLMLENHHQVIQARVRSSLEAIRQSTGENVPVFYLPPGEKFINARIKPAVFSAELPVLKFILQKRGQFLELSCLVILKDGVCPLKDLTRIHFFLQKESVFYLINKKDEKALQLFEKGMLMAHEKEKDNFLNKVVIPLAERYEVDFGELLNSSIIEEEPQGRVYLSEMQDNYLLITPRWLYGDIEVNNEDEKSLVEKDGILYRVPRHKEKEQELLEHIRNTHPKFRWQNNGYFFISFNEALQTNWFISFYQELSRVAPVYGINNLKKFRYRPSRPFIDIKASSGSDWFDVKVEVSYDGVVVPLQELRKAILNKQSYILLSDGSMGVLPEEWIEKYALMMKMGEVKNNRLQVSKFNWTIIDDLHDQLDNESLLKELLEKKNKLLKIEESKSFALPEGIKASPRHYQESGFQWLCLLNEMGWGGCLADDMGLGKTLQTIMLLQHVVNSSPKEKHLVVCPTSLIYNWEAELQKFAPSLTYYIHYGPDRFEDLPVRKNINIIITTYGLLRSDMEKFIKHKFGYVVLDESHTIKNPASQIAKAVRVLKCRNRLALSGTPLQNNTFDLYSQMEFLNPGMLGGQEFFKTEFANPIDKEGDKEKAGQLRKMIYPFMLRRTKEQVANDLPDRTESVLWCEMGEEQRKIYNSFKEHYRQTVMGHINEDGLNKSTMYVLEGLTKLRQVCDSPAILNEEITYPNHSVKLQELTRELEENTGTHKALVFSQFTTMLRLMKESLEEKGIKYYYLDGGIPAGERKKLVKQFQDNDEVRVFLISLKAGGVGLNLTAADYVYLIDPWWNPAAEQQAIDRTHRIGQHKRVFAYKMICKNTIEEKILLLQERKKKLSTDLISDETGFVKKLTKEDIAYLFE